MEAEDVWYLEEMFDASQKDTTYLKIVVLLPCYATSDKLFYVCS